LQYIWRANGWLWFAQGFGSSAGWLLSAYLLGGFGDDANGRNGVGNAVITAAKSWALGIPVIINSVILRFQACAMMKCYPDACCFFLSKVNNVFVS